MNRGRSLLWLAAILGLGATALWLAAEAGWGPQSARDAWPGLAGSAALALVVWSLFLGLHAAMTRRRPESARSLIHLQTLASAVVAVVALGAAMGGFEAAVVGFGLVGFGLTLALQRPILSVAGWASLVFGGAVRVGDRIVVGPLAGDVLDITLFTTKLWEIGAPDSTTPGRPTGRIRTVANAVFLEQTVANATSDTPTVFDEFVVNVAFESDQKMAQALLLAASAVCLDATKHRELARTYRTLTKGLPMEKHFPNEPLILAESKASWMEYRLRYLVDARQASRTQSRLTQAWLDETASHPEILPIYPRSQPMAIGGDGRALNPASKA